MSDLGLRLLLQALKTVAENQKRVEHFFIKFYDQFFEVELSIIVNSPLAMVLVDQPHHIHNQHIVILVLRVIELLSSVDCLQELLLSLGLRLGKG